MVKQIDADMLRFHCFARDIFGSIAVTSNTIVADRFPRSLSELRSRRKILCFPFVLYLRKYTSSTTSGDNKVSARTDTKLCVFDHLSINSLLLSRRPRCSCSYHFCNRMVPDLIESQACEELCVPIGVSQALR